MAVTINEFEVVTEPDVRPGANGRGNSGGPLAAPAAGDDTGPNSLRSPLTLDDLDTLMRRERERWARVWAH